MPSEGVIHGNLSPGAKVNEAFGPSKVRALPLGVAAEQSVHYFWDYFSFLSSGSHTFLLEGVVLGL